MAGEVLHPWAAELCGRHAGEGCVLLGTGESVAAGVPDWVLAGRRVLSVNSILFHPNAHAVDYYFLQDRGNVKNAHSFAARTAEYDDYLPRLGKFYGIGPAHCPHAADAERGWAQTYRVADGKDRHAWWADLERQRVGDHGSVIFAVAQFAAWMGFTDWIVAGCDLEGERFDGGCPILRPMLKSWTSQSDLIKSKATVRVWKPKGLKGLFDEFTC